MFDTYRKRIRKRDLAVAIELCHLLFDNRVFVCGYRDEGKTRYTFAYAADKSTIGYWYVENNFYPHNVNLDALAWVLEMLQVDY